jgi:hypothetical protein
MAYMCVGKEYSIGHFTVADGSVRFQRFSLGRDVRSSLEEVGFPAWFVNKAQADNTTIGVRVFKEWLTARFSTAYVRRASILYGS